MTRRGWRPLRQNQGRESGTELGRIAEEWERIVQEGDFEFLLGFHDVLEIKAVDLSGEPAFEDARRSLSGHVEGCLLRGETGPELDAFVGRLGRSLYPWDAYADTVFKDRIVSSSLIQACFRFFPDKIETFQALLQEEIFGQHDLLGRIADGLKLIDTPRSLETLEKIYEAGDAAVKVSAGRAAFSLNAWAAADFPQTSTFDMTGAFTVGRDPFVETLNKVGRAASRDETRPILTGVLMTIMADTLKMVATDSYRLAARAIIAKCLTSARARDAAPKARDLVIRKSALESLTLPGKLADCSEGESTKTELYIVEGDRPAARPSRAATGISRPFCLCAARS